MRQFKNLGLLWMNWRNIGIIEYCSIKKLGTYDLTGCELYATGYPCPMCLSAIIWANIKKVYYCNDVKQAENIGFRDDFIYDYIKNGNSHVLDLESCKTEEACKLYEQYAEMHKIIY